MLLEQSIWHNMWQLSAARHFGPHTFRISIGEDMVNIVSDAIPYTQLHNHPDNLSGSAVHLS